MTLHPRPLRRQLLLATLGVMTLALAGCQADGTDAATVAVAVRTEAGVPRLEIEASGLEPGQEYLARLHAGTCEAAGASGGGLGTLTADADGHATLATSTVLVGAGGAPADLTAELLADGDHAVRLVAVGGDEAACATVP